MKIVQDELAKELCNLSSPIKYSETDSLRYLCSSIKEAMRLYPNPGLNLPRHSPRGGMQVSGYHIPEGFRVGVNPTTVTYDEATYGSDVAEFKPERWLTNGVDLRHLERGMALAFGAGTRTCVGKNVSDGLEMRDETN